MIDNYTLDKQVYKKNTNELHREKTEKTEKTVLSNTRSDLKMGNLPTIFADPKFSKQFNVIANKPPSTRLDWLTLVSPKQGIEPRSLDKVITNFIEGRYWEKTYDYQIFETNRQLYEGGPAMVMEIVSAIGVRLRIAELENGNYFIILSFCGDALSQLFRVNNFLAIAKFFAESVEQFSLKASRIDLAFDDPQKKLNIIELHSHLRAGNYTGFKNYRGIDSGVGKIEGYTLELGSRTSNTFTRIYDTWKKHKEVGIRYESEFKRTNAKELQKFFVNAYEVEKTNKQLLKQLHEYMFTNIRFIDISKKYSNGSLEKCPVLPIWQNFLKYVNDKLELRKFIKPKKESTIEQTANWFKRQVSGTLEVFKNALGDNNFLKFIEYCIADSVSRQRHKATINKRMLFTKQLKRLGILGVLTQEEIDYATNNCDIDFGYLSPSYEPVIKEENLKANKRILRAMLRKDNVVRSQIGKENPTECADANYSLLIDYQNRERLEDELDDYKSDYRESPKQVLTKEDREFILTSIAQGFNQNGLRDRDSRKRFTTEKLGLVFSSANDMNDEQVLKLYDEVLKVNLQTL